MEAKRENALNGSETSPRHRSFISMVSDINLDFDHGEVSTEVDDHGMAALMDTQMKCKKCFYIFIYLIWVITVAFSLLVCFVVGEENESGMDFFDSEFELDDDQAWQLVAVWYLAIFGFG